LQNTTTTKKELISSFFGNNKKDLMERCVLMLRPRSYPRRTQSMRLEIIK
jgi:hypothetical protein